MSIESELREILKQDVAEKSNFSRQLGKFRDFEAQLADSGIEIEKKKFSIALMDRLSVSFLEKESNENPN